MLAQRQWLAYIVAALLLFLFLELLGRFPPWWNSLFGF